MVRFQKLHLAEERFQRIRFVKIGLLIKLIFERLLFLLYDLDRLPWEDEIIRFFFFFRLSDFWVFFRRINFRVIW